MSLVRVLQEVRQNGTPAQQQGRLPPQAAALPAQVQQTVLMLQWFVNEAQQLSPEARLEAFKYPSLLPSDHYPIPFADPSNTVRNNFFEEECFKRLFQIEDRWESCQRSTSVPTPVLFIFTHLFAMWLRHSGQLGIDCISNRFSN